MDRMGGREPQENMSFQQMLKMVDLLKSTQLPVINGFVKINLSGVSTPPQTFRESLADEFKKNGWGW